MTESAELTYSITLPIHVTGVKGTRDYACYIHKNNIVGAMVRGDGFFSSNLWEVEDTPILGKIKEDAKYLQETRQKKEHEKLEAIRKAKRWNEGEAVVNCRNATEKKVNYPETIKYPWFSHILTPMAEDSWLVNEDLTATNGYGVPIRLRYKCITKSKNILSIEVYKR